MRWLASMLTDETAEKRFFKATIGFDPDATMALPQIPLAHSTAGGTFLGDRDRTPLGHRVFLTPSVQALRTGVSKQIEEHRPAHFMVSLGKLNCPDRVSVSGAEWMNIHCLKVMPEIRIELQQRVKTVDPCSCPQ